MVCLALTALPCQALDIGRANVNSAIGEPLVAHVRIRLESGEHIDNSCLSVGDRDDFPDSDHVLITDAKLSLLTSRNAIRISTSKPLDVPAVSMALRVRCANGPLTVRALDLYLNPSTESYSTDIMSSLAGTSITVKPGDSVYGLARTIFPRSEKAVRDLALAIIVANPALFPDERPRPLQIGERLTIPDLRTVQRIVADSGISPVTGLPLEPPTAKTRSPEPPTAKTRSPEPPTAKIRSPDPQPAESLTSASQALKSQTAASKKTSRMDRAASNVAVSRAKPDSVQSGKLGRTAANRARATGTLHLKLALSINLTPSIGMTEARRAVLRQGLRPAVAIAPPQATDPGNSGLTLRIARVREAQDGINAQLAQLDVKVAVLKKSALARNVPVRTPLPTSQLASPLGVLSHAVSASQAASTWWKNSPWWKWPASGGVALLLVAAGIALGRKRQTDDDPITNQQGHTSNILEKAPAAATSLLGSEPAPPGSNESVRPAADPGREENTSKYGNDAPSTLDDAESSFERAAGETIIDPSVFIPAAGESSSSSLPSPYPDIIDPSSPGDVTQELERAMDDALDGTRSMFSDVDRFIALGRIENALSLLDFQIKNNPTDRDAWIKLMAVYKHEGMDGEFKSAHAAFSAQFGDG